VRKVVHQTAREIGGESLARNRRRLWAVPRLVAFPRRIASAFAVEMVSLWLNCLVRITYISAVPTELAT
jgi:hypothetical protein